MSTLDPFAAPWHRRSWDDFLERALPDLLAERLPLTGYQLGEDDPASATRPVHIFLAGAHGDVENAYEVHRPDVHGVFHLSEGELVCVPIAEADVDLAQAGVRCAGEQVLQWLSERLRTAGPDERPVDAADARSWLPLDQWLHEFFLQPGLQPWDRPGTQRLQKTNWLDRTTHLRRVQIPDRQQVVTDGHSGRVCPVETPEGPNVGRVLAVARGAEIRDQRLCIVAGEPAGHLGISAACIPFLEHDDLNRALMGANMMRQWLPPAEREPALVRTGFEPGDDDFWCGHNLLTAFITWDEGCFEDGLVISESAAQRMACPEPLAVGDKLSHRHGAKGVVSQILPNADMPALADGTPVELICSLSSLPSRLSLGALREAVISRIAHGRGDSVDVAPFAAPPESDLRRQLAEAGLAPDGMEQLSLQGQELQYRSTVGWIYWGSTMHRARGKLHAAVDPAQRDRQRLLGPTSGDQLPYGPQRMGELDAVALRAAAAYETIREHFVTRALGHGDGPTLASSVAAGVVQQASAPSPQFNSLHAGLDAAGIRLTLEADSGDGSLSVSLADPTGETLELAEPRPHPWLAAAQIQQVGAHPQAANWTALTDANQRLRRALSSQAPQGLVTRARSQLQHHLSDYLDGLVDVEDLLFQSQVLFSARGVITAASRLQHDQIGIPEDVAWVLFGPLVARELGDADAVAERTAAATEALDQAMGSNWMILYRAPAVLPSNFIAFQPVRVAGSAIRVHPLATAWLNADFDGDQAAVFLPVTQVGQQEARTQLSLASHFARDPDVVRPGWLSHDAMWGLAHLARTAAGRKSIDEVAGKPVCTAEPLSSRMVRQALGDGPDAVDAHARLMQLGFHTARLSGASMGAFVGSGLQLPLKPDESDRDAIESYSAEVQSILADFTDFDNHELGPTRLAQASGARGSLYQLSVLVGAHVGQASPWSQCEGQPMETFLGFARAAWGGLQQLHEKGPGWHTPIWGAVQRLGSVQPAGGSASAGLLSRARMSRRPGVVFARAAWGNEVDPLTDTTSRLWVGLPVV